jgi:hypothetical protein
LDRAKVFADSKPDDERRHADPPGLIIALCDHVLGPSALDQAGRTFMIWIAYIIETFAP